MPSISATIITHNESLNIARAIRSLRCADEVVVLDSGSADDTVERARQEGARVCVHPWMGFAAQKNFAVEQARHDWILSLDADEELDGEAAAAVCQWKNSQPDCAGYRFSRRARYLGRWVHHSGWFPDFKLRLFDRKRSRWVGEFVHESVRVQGPVGKLPGTILHYTCDSLEDHRRRIEFYTDLAAAELCQQGKHIGRLRRHAGPYWTFLQTYFFRLGLLDGLPGFWISWMAGRYVARKYDKWARQMEKPMVSGEGHVLSRGPSGR